MIKVTSAPNFCSTSSIVIAFFNTGRYNRRAMTEVRFKPISKVAIKAVSIFRNKPLIPFLSLP